MKLHDSLYKLGDGQIVSLDMIVAVSPVLEERYNDRTVTTDPYRFKIKTLGKSLTVRTVPNFQAKGPTEATKVQLKEEVERWRDELLRTWSDYKGSPSRGIEVVVNGRTHKLARTVLSYSDVVRLAYPNARPQRGEVFSITYFRGPQHKPEGILSPAGVVPIQQGMVFTAMVTGNA
jgi:hypothetical protein